MKTNQLEKAYWYCEWITSHHYENFPVASLLLPPSIRPHVAAIYAFARCADDYADEAKYRGESLRLLDGWRSALWACSTNGASHPIFLALADTISRCNLPVQLLDDLLTAFTMDVTKKRYADWEELLTYCRLSANPVGRLVLLIFGLTDPSLAEWSDRICTGLQLANHWQDLGVDFLEKNRLYVPKTLLSQHRVSETELRGIKMGLVPSGFHPLMTDLVQRARTLFDGGESLLKHVTGSLRLELKLTLLGGRSILDKIEASDYDVIRRRPVLSGVNKLRLLTHALCS